MSRWVCLLFLTAWSNTLWAQQTSSQKDALASVEGHCVYSLTGEPIQKAQVTLGSYEGENSFELVATTNEAGHFRFADISPGVYKLIGDKTGFIAGQYGQVKAEDQGSLLKISTGDRLQDLTLRLFPAGAISGQVLDPDGDPVPGYEVLLWTRKSRTAGTPNSPVDGSTTNQAGEYRFGGLLRDTYFVSASPASSGGPAPARQTFVDSNGKATKLHELRTFYPSALSLSAAQSVHIENGQEQSGVDVRMRRGLLFSVTGKIAGTVAHKSEYQVSATLDEGLGWTSKPGKLLPNGEFVVDDLPPGNHRLVVTGQGTSGPKEIGMAEINLIDESVTGVLITPFAPAMIRVRVVLEGAEDKLLTAGSVFLNPVEENRKSRDSKYQLEPHNGTYVFNDVSPGRYQIDFTNAGKSYLKSTQSAGRLVDPGSIEVTEGAHLDLLVTYSKNLASVSGDVEVEQAQEISSVHVILVDEDTSSITGKTSIAEIDQFLHFSVEDVRPGKYLVFAAEDDDLDLWGEPQFVKLLQSEGSECDLREKKHATVHLKLIPKDLTERIRQQLGI